MKRITLATATLASLAAAMLLAGDARAAIRSFSIQNDLDDTCNVFVNGRFAGRVYPFERTPPRNVEYENVPGRTNILLRCEDGGLYGTSIEAEYEHCDFTVDEEGGGMRGVCY
jgi:hypothetical protein